MFSCRVFEYLNEAPAEFKYRKQGKKTLRPFSDVDRMIFFDPTEENKCFLSDFSTCTAPKCVRVWSIEYLLLNKNRQNFTRPIYMLLCIFYLLTVRRQENKVFSNAFAARKHAFSCRRIEIIIIIIIIIN